MRITPSSGSIRPRQPTPIGLSVFERAAALWGWPELRERITAAMLPATMSSRTRLQTHFPAFPCIQTLRHHCHFELTVSVLHVVEQIRQFFQANLPGNEIGRGYRSRSNSIQRLPNETRRVMEAG